MSAAADVIAAIERTLLDTRNGRRHGDEIAFRCVYPDQHANGDAKPAASWNTKKHLWFCQVCHAKGGWKKLAEALNIELPKRRGRKAKAAPTIVETYDYLDSGGDLLFQVVRFEPKDFRQRRPDGKGGWIWNLDGVEPVLYRLPELLAAPAGSWVFIPEGEKDAKALVQLELIATTSPMGAENWREHYADSLTRQHVVILPDNDDKGRKHVQQVARSVFRVAASVRIVELPGLPPKGDVSDWLAAGHGKGELLNLVEGTAPLTRRTIESVVATFRKWQHMPDPAALYATLGTIAANLMPGDPVWLLVVGPPSSGKTEILVSLSRLPHVHAVGTLTEASLLSGTAIQNKAADAKGGLLREIGEFGVIVCKDFTSVLAINRDARASVLAALREIHDGAWTRRIGQDGGRALHWQGKVAFIAGCTPTIDSHHAVIAAMGERFVWCRLPDTDGLEQGMCALKHVGREVEMRSDLCEAVALLFAGLNLTASCVTHERRKQVVKLASLAVRCRSAVERDAYRREIDLVPESEAPARLALTLVQLYGGMLCVGVAEAEAWRVVVKVALDSMPAIRRKVFGLLLSTQGQLDTSEIAERTGYPTVTARRACEDLTAHGIVVRTAGGQGKADLWELSAWARERYEQATVSEKSDAQNPTDPTFSEMSDGDGECHARFSPFNSSLSTEEEKTEKVPPAVAMPGGHRDSCEDSTCTGCGLGASGLVRRAR